ncbi:hypothetical protein V2J09_014341 [Rumex salicifolius]
MDDVAAEVMQAEELRHHLFGVLSGSHHNPPTNVLNLLNTTAVTTLVVVLPGESLDPPKPTSLIILCRLYGLIELRLDVKVPSVPFQVAYELGTPFSFSPAATARPDGPAPTITGPLTHVQRRARNKSSWFRVDIVFCLYKFLCLEERMLEGEFEERV